MVVAGCGRRPDGEAISLCDGTAERRGPNRLQRVSLYWRPCRIREKCSGILDAKEQRLMPPCHEDAKEKVTGEEEDSGAQVAPIVKFDEVVVTTGEENEDVLLAMKEKLYRFDKDGNQWKERGLWTVKLLKHEDIGKVWKEELFCIRLGSAENAKKFKEVIEEIKADKSNKGDKSYRFSQCEAEDERRSDWHMATIEWIVGG
eukprot:Gb_30456 [translate_table: standard]